jgi:tellurite resistance protein
MQAHADAATVQEKGCGVLSNLSATDEASKIRIVEEEALDAIVMAMVLHSDNGAVQDRACSVLKRLAIEPNLKQMQAANVAELVEQALANFPDRCGDKAKQILSFCRSGT